MPEGCGKPAPSSAATLRCARSPIRQQRNTPGSVDCVDLALIPAEPALGRGSRQSLAMPRSASSSARFRWPLAGQVDAICTAPINKQALHARRARFSGHTEILAALTGTPEVSMMLMTPKLRVIHVTAHIGLIDAIAKIEPDLVERTVLRGHAALVRAGLPRPRIGVCGINPHAGENGLFGHGEEQEKIEPATRRLVAQGLDVTGPLPADTLFFRAQRGDFDLGRGDVP